MHKYHYKNKILRSKNIIFNVFAIFFVSLTVNFAVNLDNVFAAGISISAGSNLDINDSTLILQDDIVINGSFIASTGELKLAGTWTALSGNSFSPGSSTVTLIGEDQSINGTSTFFNLSKGTNTAVVLTLQASTTQTINNKLILTGSSGNLLSLRSSASPGQFIIKLVTAATHSLSFLDVKDSDNSPSEGANDFLDPANSIDSSNNTNWFTPSSGGGGGGGSSDDDSGGVAAVPTPEPTPVLITDFKADPVSGKSPLSVSFTDLSTGSISNRSWEFGDGQSIQSSSGRITVSHTYSINGTYTVSLEVTRSGIKQSVTKTDLIIVSDLDPTPTPTPVFGVVADFKASPVNGVAPLEVQLFDRSSGDIDKWLWDFGDGDISLEQEPLHTYISKGTFDISLTVTGPGGTHTVTKQDFITVAETDNDLLAEFSAFPTKGNIPLLVRFNDLSSGRDADKWLWEFGDGNTSNQQNPTHIYNTQGTFTVSLKIESGKVSAIAKKSGLIEAVAANAPVVDFSAISREGFSPFDVQFQDLSQGDITSWLWEFGDGNTSEQQNPVHVYKKEGRFTVSLKATSPGGENKKVVVDFINIMTKEEIIVDFDSTVRKGNVPFSTQFSNLTDGNIDEYLWIFGDSGTSNEKEPKYTYTKPGNYTVILEAISPNGRIKRSKEFFIQAVPAGVPIAEFDSITYKGFGPLAIRYNNETNDNSNNVQSTSRRPFRNRLRANEENSDSNTRYFWDFGDGQTSNERNPAHTYAKDGLFTVRLTAENDLGSSSESKQAFIKTIPRENGLLADFDALRKKGINPLSVQFNDLSFGNDIVSWTWNFGDGNSSNESNPEHVYEQAGLYTVSLVIKNSSNESSIDVKEGFITILPSEGPFADFEFVGSSGITPFNVQFIDNSFGEITGWLWDFGDGVTSTERSPTHTYTSSGVFDVKLTINGSKGIDVMEKRQIINVGSPSETKADFIGSLIKGQNPLVAQFIDTSAGDITSWLWDFGDGNISNEQNPAHTYEIPGNYSVSLLVGNSGETDTVIKRDFITVVKSGTLLADFTSFKSVGYSPFKVRFSDISLGDVTSWLWDFGDGNTSSKRNPTHTYTSEGDFAVSLAITGNDGSNIKVERSFINVLPESSPLANFDSSIKRASKSSIVPFKDMSEGDIVSWNWNFGDGNVSNEQNPVHIYERAGVYTVSLGVTGENGTKHIKAFTDFITILPEGVPNVDFDITVSSGLSPLNIQFLDLSDGVITDWIWDFGDGVMSNEQNPFHVYNEPGVYAPRLSVNTSAGTFEHRKLNFIVAKEQEDLVSEFSATPVDIIGSGNVFFTDLSVGDDVTSWLWDFGDGFTSEDQSPVHEYTSPGLYTVVLKISNSNGSDEIQKVNMINVRTTDSFISEFDASPRNAFSPASVQFTNMSSGSGITNWLWDFGDGVKSQEENPIHTYEMPGHFDVTLLAGDSPFASVNTKPHFIVTHEDGILVKFESGKQEGKAPFEVQFTDGSEGNDINKWFWDFGDGETSQEQNPLHIYSRTGIFTVTLVVSGETEGSFRKNTDFIKVLLNDAILVDFEANPTKGNTPLEVVFTDQSEGEITSWSWDFGDGKTSVEQNPVHVYEDAGLFTVSLTASNGLDFETEKKIDLINVEESNPIDFDALITVEPENIVLNDKGRFSVFITFAPESPINVSSLDCGSIVCEGAEARNCSIVRGGNNELEATFNVNDLSVDKIGHVPFEVVGDIISHDGTRFKFGGIDFVNLIGVLGVDPSLELATPSDKAPASANFAGSPNKGITPLSVQFRNLSTGPIVSHSWEFGDGGISSEVEPFYTYVAPGMYSPKLTIETEDGNRFSETKENYIEVGLTEDVSAWSMFRQNQRRDGSSPSLGSFELGILWVFDSGDGIESSPSVTKNGNIYFGSFNGRLYALNPDGKELWNFRTQGPIVSSPAIDNNGNIYFGSNDGNVYALMADGTLLWHFETEGEVPGSPVISQNGLVLVGSFDGVLYALDIINGQVIWQFKTDDSIFASPSIGNDGTVYIGSYDGKLYALTNDGELKWEFKTESFIRSTPVVTSNGIIYVCSWDKNLYAVDDTGKMVWSFDLGDTTDCTPATNGKGDLCVGTDGGNLFFINSNGELTSQLNLGRNVILRSSPALGPDGVVYFGSGDGKFYSVNSEGNVIWFIDPIVPFPIYASPTINKEGNILITSEQGIIFSVGKGASQSSQESLNERIIRTIDTLNNDVKSLKNNSLKESEIDDSDSLPMRPRPFLRR